MSISRGGFLFEIFTSGAIGKASPSLKLCPRKIDIVRLKALGHMGINFHEEYFGDTLTWWELTSAGLGYGNNLVTKYQTLEVGWTYELDAVSKIFTVTDSIGNKTSVKIKTLSDLGIVRAIFESHQFRIYFSASFINDAFLIASIKRRNGGDGGAEDETKDDTSMYPPYLLAYVDQFFIEKLHWKCKRLVSDECRVPQLENIITQEITAPKEVQILRSNVPVRSATGNFSDMAIYAPKVKCSLAQKQRNVIIDIVLGEFLMIAYFASLIHMNKPVYEPWMLFGIWKWLGSGDPILSIEKIFDLSPRW